MPSRLKRFQETGRTHFVTFSCHERRPLLSDPCLCSLFEHELEETRQAFRFCVYGYVIMPEHVHLLLSEPECKTLATGMQVLKQNVSRKAHQLRPHPSVRKGGGPQDGAHMAFWLPRYHDRNVRDHHEFVRKLQYLHRNPVTRGLARTADEWKWSSFHHYLTGEPGVVEIESEWTARRRVGEKLNVLKPTD